VTPRVFIQCKLHQGKNPIYKHLWVWGCVAYPQVPKEPRKKIDKAAWNCILIGYIETTTQYHHCDPIGKYILSSHDVILAESTWYYNTSDMVHPESRYDYVQEIQVQPESWEEWWACGNKFGEEEALGVKTPERRVREEEQEAAFDLGEAE